MKNSTSNSLSATSSPGRMRFVVRRTHRTMLEISIGAPCCSLVPKERVKLQGKGEVTWITL